MGGPICTTGGPPSRHHITFEVQTLVSSFTINIRLTPKYRLGESSSSRAMVGNSERYEQGSAAERTLDRRYTAQVFPFRVLSLNFLIT